MVKWLSVIVIFALTACNASRLAPQVPAASNGNERTPQVVQNYGEHLWVDFPDTFAQNNGNGPGYAGAAGEMVADNAGNVYYPTLNGIDKVNYSGTVTPLQVIGPWSNDGPWWPLNNPGVAFAGGSVWSTHFLDRAGAYPSFEILDGFNPQTGAQANVTLYEGFPSEEEYAYITPGFHSDLWLLDFRLRHYDYSTNKLTNYPIPESGSAITRGPDGNIWYLAKDGVFKANPTSGAVQKFNVSGLGNVSGFGGIVGGPNGHLYTISADCILNEISTAGVVVRHASFGVKNCGPQLLVANGAVWDAGNDQTSTCSPAATYLLEWKVEAQGAPVTKTLAQNSVWGPAPCGPLGPRSVAGGAVGSDGNLYFVMQNGTIGVRILSSITVDPYVSIYTFTSPYKYLTLTVSETNYAGSWTATSLAPAVVRVVKWLSRTQVQIESAGKGSGRIIIRDTKNNYYNVFVSVQ